MSFRCLFEHLCTCFGVIIACLVYNESMAVGKSKNKGFTAIEMIISIALAVILFAIIVNGFSGQRDHVNLGLAVDDSMSFLQEARAKTLSSESASVYGVHFETNKVVLFTGDTYNPLNPANENRNLSVPVEISNILLNGGAVDVVFKRLTGETDAHGTVTLRFSSDPTITRIILIEPTGLAHIQ